MKPFILGVSALLLAGCATAETPAAMASAQQEPSALEEFAALAVGSWSSREQSADPRYDWVNSETVRILRDRSDGIWLYQENAILARAPDEAVPPDALDRPYFQVVIQLRGLGHERIHSTTYRLDSPEARAGARGIGRDPSPDLEEDWIGSVACMGVIDRVGMEYWQGSLDCPNTFRGGVKVDSRTIRTPDTYVNWDRGFDAEGNHVWGPSAGGYIFRRKRGDE